MTSTAAETAAAAPPCSSEAPSSRPYLKHVLVPLANGTDEVQLSILTSTLLQFGDRAAHVVVASIDGDDNRMCTTRGNLQIQAEHTFDSIKDHHEWDMIVFVGGIDGAKAFAGCQPLMETFRTHVEAGKMYAATGESPAYVLTQVPGALATSTATTNGVTTTDGHTCFPSQECCDLMGEAWVNVDVAVSQDNRVVTSQGTGPAFLFALQVGELLFGKVAAKKVANTMLVDRTLSLGARYHPPRQDLERFAAKVKAAEAKAREAQRREQAKEAAKRQSQERRDTRARNTLIAQANRAFHESQLSGPQKEESDRLAAWSTPAAVEARKRAAAALARSGAKRRSGTSDVVRVSRSSITHKQLVFATIWLPLEALGWTYRSKRNYCAPLRDHPSITNVDQLLAHCARTPSLADNELIVHGRKWHDACYEVWQDRKNDLPKENVFAWLFDQVEQAFTDMAPRPDSEEFQAKLAEMVSLESATVTPRTENATPVRHGESNVASTAGEDRDETGQAGAERATGEEAATAAEVTSPAMTDKPATRRAPRTKRRHRLPHGSSVLDVESADP